MHDAGLAFLIPLGITIAKVAKHTALWSWGFYLHITCQVGPCYSALPVLLLLSLVGITAAGAALLLLGGYQCSLHCWCCCHVPGLTAAAA